MSRALIVTADDVGLHPCTTLAAIQGHEQGIVTACSLIANGRSFDHAVAALREHSSLAVGVHLTLVGERPVTPANDIPSLVDRGGNLLAGHGAFVRRFLAGRIDLGEVERELRAQLQRVLAAGIAVTHLNSHQHLHVLPGLLDVTIRLAGEYGIGYVRTPLDRWRLGHASAARAMLLRALRLLARRARRLVRATGTIRTNDATIGVASAGRLSSARLLALLPLVHGCCELVCHPGLDDAELGRTYRWGYRWEAELGGLCDPGVRDLLRRLEIDLIAPAESE